MTATYTAIATTTLAADAASYTFSSIPQTYTDLVLMSALFNNGTGNSSLAMRFNGDTAANYGTLEASGTGSSTYTGQALVGTVTFWYGNFKFIAQGINNQYTPFVTNIMNYSSTNTIKTGFTQYGSTGYVYNADYASSGFIHAAWNSTAAITSILVRLDGNNLPAGSTFTLYGIKAE
jgi:hypothetical protein